MNYKKLLLGVATLTLCFMLTGCGHEHTWKEATCTEPKACSECGEIEGEPLGHTWVEATCSEPKHCSVCGETEGEPLEHTLTEANYQQAATCEVCGATVGEPLQADFEKYGLTCDAELDVEYPYTTTCGDNENYITTGKLTFTDYEVFTPDDTFEAIEGYEWRTVTMTCVFYDENAWEYGCSSFITFSDYYDINGFEDNYDNTNETYTINYNGTEYSDVCWYYDDLSSSGWVDHTFTYKYRIYLRVPVGYDGTVIAWTSRANKGKGTYLNEFVDDGTIIFRCK